MPRCSAGRPAIRLDARLPGQPADGATEPAMVAQPTSACSPTPYRDDLFGPDFVESVFIAEPVHNVVHREVLDRDGTGWQAGARPRRRKANSSHPPTIGSAQSSCTRGPMVHQRVVADAIAWCSAPGMDLAGNAKRASTCARRCRRRRIYRIAPRGGTRRRVANPCKRWKPPRSPRPWANGWQRDTAHRLLVEKHDPTAIPRLRACSARRCPVVECRRWRLWAGWVGLDDALLLSALADPHPWVRCEALRQSRPFLTTCVSTVAALADADPAVRLQVALSLDAWPAARTEPVLAALATEEDMRVAVMSSLRPESPLFQRLQDKAASPWPPRCQR